MMCLPGLDPASNCTASFDAVFPQQWVAMRVLTLVFPSAGLVFAGVLLWDYLRGDSASARQPSGRDASMFGLALMVVAELCLILYYAIDPGFLAAIRSGYYSGSYVAGLTTFIWFAAALSGCATAILVGFWVSLLRIGGARFFALSGPAVVIVLAIAAYFLVVAVVASVSVAFCSVAPS
jgi:hypothetical protein